MRNNSLIFIGIGLIVAGGLFLLGNIFDFNVLAACLPAGLILLGLYLILRPRLVGPDTRMETTFIGDLEIADTGTLQNSDFTMLIGDVELDLTKAKIPAGETTISCNGFIGDINVLAPADIGLSVQSTAVISEIKPPGQPSQENFFSTGHWQSDGYKTAERRVRIQVNYFISDTTIRQA